MPMKRKFSYTILFSALFATIVSANMLIFDKEPPSRPETNEPDYTYLSKYTPLSHFDHHFREAADTLQYDWTLIAAIAFTESRFDSTAISAAGARGVMQMMPKTMRGMEIPDSLHMDSRTNIMAAAELLASLEKHYRYISNPDERLNFVLAAYNAGFGHINDAMRLAHKYGKNKYRWNGNVDSFLIYKSLPEYYTDTLCRNGEFKDWKQTLSFVKKVRRHWKRFSKRQEEYSDSIKELILTDSTKRIMQ